MRIVLFLLIILFMNVSYCQNVFLDALKIDKIEDDSKEKFTSFIAKLNREIDITDDHADIFEDIFEYLHNNVLTKYKAPSKINSILLNGQYDCLTGVILYSAICQEMNLPFKIYATSNHVYLKCICEDKEILVEITNPNDGFDFGKSLDDVIEHLIEYKLISMSEFQNMNTDDIYDELIVNSKETTPQELISYLLGNYSSIEIGKESYKSAYSYIERTLLLNPDYKNFQYLYTIIYSMLLFEMVNNNSYDEEILLAPITKNFKFDKMNEMLLVGILKLAEKYIDNSEFNKSDSLFTSAELYFGDNEKELLSPREQKSLINIKKAHELILFGEYKSAFNLMRDNYNNSPKDINKRAYIHVGIRYCYNLFDTGNYEISIAILDSLITQFPAIHSIKEAYAKICMGHISQRNLLREAPKEAKRLLEKAIEVGPSFEFLQIGLRDSFLQLAYAKVRKKEYREAVKIIDNGLKRFQDDKKLLDEKNIIKSLIK